MRNWCLITAVLLLSCVWLVAQSSSSPATAPDQSQANQQQQPDTSQQKEPTADHGAHTIVGCITTVAGGFTLTDNSGKTYQLTGDTSKLAQEVGHVDQVSGTEESKGAASSGATPTFTVRKIKVVSTTCPAK